MTCQPANDDDQTSACPALVFVAQAPAQVEMGGT